MDFQELKKANLGKNMLVIDPLGKWENQRHGVEYARTDEEITQKAYAVLTKLRDPNPEEPAWLILVDGLNVGDNARADELVGEINNRGGHERGYAVLWSERNVCGYNVKQNLFYKDFRKAGFFPSD